MLICNKCGKTINESDLNIQQALVGQYGNENAYERWADKCLCGGEFVEAASCDCCEEYALEADMQSGWRYNIKICKECLNYYKHKYQRIYNQLTINGIEDFIDWLEDNGDISKKNVKLYREFKNDKRNQYAKNDSTIERT